MSTARIAAIGKVIRGVSWDKDDASDSPRADYMPILRAGNIGNELNTESDLVWVPASNVSNEQKIRAGDIAICMSSGSPTVVGKTASAVSDWPGSVGAFCALIRANPEKCLPEYLAFFLKSERFRSWTSEAQGANIKNIKKSALEDFDIWVPPLPEQRRIVDLLSRADGIVRLRREAEKKAAELIPALFLDMFGDPATNPKGWVRTELGTLLDSIDSGHSPKCHSQQKQPHQWGVLKLSALSGGLYREEEHKTLPKEISPDTTVEVRSGDVLLSRKNTYELVGTAAYVRKTIGRILLPDLIFRLNITDSERLNPVYLWGLLSMNAKREQIRKLASGSAGSMPNISKARLKTLEIELPPHQDQIRFSLSVEQIRSIQSQQSTATAKAQATFDALLAQAFHFTESMA